jgi:hypothetical protein
LKDFSSTESLPKIYCFTKRHYKDVDDQLNKNYLLSDYLDYYLTSQVTSIQHATGIFWSSYIYSSRAIAGPAQPIDCLNTCLNIETGLCQFFVFANPICNLGQYGLIEQTVVAQSDGPVSIYIINGITNIIIKEEIVTDS